MPNKKIISLIAILLVVFTLVACKQDSDLAVVNSNLADYQQSGVAADTEEISLEFNQELATTEVTLLKNGTEVDQFETDISDQQLVIKDFELVPIADYKLVIVAKDVDGQKLTNSYQFTTKPATHPQVSEQNETLLQSFYWELGKGDYADEYSEEVNLWNLLAKRADKFAELGITSIWVPPANKGQSPNDVGYGVYDLWDLGEFDQAGGVRTKYGTREELEAAIADLHKNDISVYYDAVLNHRIGTGDRNLERTVLKSGKEIKSYTDFSNLKGREQYYSKADEWEWNWKQFDGVDYDANRGEITPQTFQGKEWDQTYDKDYLLGADIDYQSEKVIDELNEWGSWIIDDIGFDGFRIDASKHIDSNFIDQWLSTVQENTDKDVFFVGESWIDNKMGLSFYLSEVDNQDLAVFDFPLRNVFKQFESGTASVSSLGSAGLVNDETNGQRAVTFVDNHDTGRDVTEYNAPINKRKMQAYTYILTRAEGKPMVYWKDYYQNDYQKELDKLLEIRKHYAYGPEREVDNNGDGVYSYVRDGLEDKPRTGLVAMISLGNSREVATKRIKTNKPNTTFYDYTRNIKEAVTTDEDGYGEFKVQQSQKAGWSTWIPSN
ncbi:MAG: alpha-amylase domain-containing protein [Bacillota bacterium]